MARWSPLDSTQFTFSFILLLLFSPSHSNSSAVYVECCWVKRFYRPPHFATSFLRFHLNKAKGWHFFPSLSGFCWGVQVARAHRVHQELATPPKRTTTRQRRQRGEKRFIPISLLLDFASSSSVLPRWHFDDDDNERPSVRPSVVCLFAFVFYYFSHVHDERRTTTTTIKEEEEEEEEEEKNDSFLLVGCLRFVIVKWTRLDMPCRAVLFITREIQ